jgi:probable HAF family extracellular repeat protein
MSSLGSLGGDSYANGISSNGQVIVGQSGTVNNATYHAFRWTSATGMQSVEQWLASSGITIGPGLSTFEAWATNADGSVVVGTLQNDHAFVARLGSGLIDVQDFTGSLAGSAPVPAFAIQDASLVMHGAHGHPVSGVLPAGKQDLWFTGDWGRSDHGEMDGSLGTAEVGYARGITEDATLKVALGRTGSSQDTAHGGEVRSRSTYLLPELVVAFPGSRLHATFSAGYTWGEVDIDRGYLNAGLEDHSKGSPDVRSAAARVRLDWREAFGTGRAAFTPFLSLTRIRTRIDAYTERGGGFPAQWDARRESSTQSRLGLDARWLLSERTAWNGRAEYVHRFEKHGTRASGQILGLSAFSMPGLSYRRNWISGGLGLEHTFGALTGSLMLTASTEGGDPTYWASGTLRWRF